MFAFLAAASFFATAFSLAQTQPSNLTARQQFLRKLVAAAEERTHHIVRYDPPTFAFRIPAAMFPRIPAYAPMR